ncbi:hypothetical protein O3P69_019041 [Scylla paramamosain]|uniref:Uncharacterized protein n=1 Tax=Scylla paramamosain TaxID=85552 RepID=A0AAW0T806_SCYPA
MQTNTWNCALPLFINHTHKQQQLTAGGDRRVASLPLPPASQLQHGGGCPAVCHRPPHTAHSHSKGSGCSEIY